MVDGPVDGGALFEVLVLVMRAPMAPDRWSMIVLSDPFGGERCFRVVGVDGVMFDNPTVFVRYCSSAIDEARRWTDFCVSDLSDAARVDEVLVRAVEPPRDSVGLLLWLEGVLGLATTVANCPRSRDAAVW